MKKVIAAIIIFLLIFVLYFLIISALYPEMSNRGLFGDTFGGINAVFSGLAFLGITYAIILQREELKLQWKNLEQTRKELERTARAQEKSEKDLSKQAESLRATSKLNGLSAILQYYGTLLEAQAVGRYGVNNDDNHYKAQADQIKRRIEDIIADK